MNWPQITDNTTNDVGSSWRATEAMRPGIGASFVPGTVLYLPSLDLGTFPDARTVLPTPAVDLCPLIMGVVPGEAGKAGVNGGFDALGGFQSPVVGGTRGTKQIDTTIWGQHGAVFIDNSGAAATPIVHGAELTSSQVSVGRAQGAAGRSFSRSRLIGCAILPASGFGSNLTAGAPVQAFTTVTLANVTAGSSASVAFQITGSSSFPGLPQYGVVSTGPLPAGATNASAATAEAAALNADPRFAALYVATSNGAAITITAIGTGSIRIFFPYSNVQNSNPIAGGFSISASGSGANGLSIQAQGTNGVTGTVANNGTLAGGVGYFGTLPVFIEAAV